MQEVNNGMKSVRAETGILFARDVQQILRRNDWGGTKAGDKNQTGALIYSWERSIQQDTVKAGIQRVMSQSSMNRLFVRRVTPAFALRHRHFLAD